MKPFFVIALFLISVSVINCDKDLGSVDSNSNKGVYPPVSDSVPIPDINGEIGIESGDAAIIWTSCEDAVGYELQRTNIGGGWELAYSGTNLRYAVGVIPSDVSISFRVRAVYTKVVSKWSNVFTF